MKHIDGGQLPKADAPMNLVFLGALYLSEVCALLVVFATYRLAYKRDVLDFVFSGADYLFLAGTVGLVASGVVIIHQIRKNRQNGSRQLVQTLVMNLFVVLFLVAVGEGALRLISVQTKAGVVIGDTLLRPREWQEVATRYSDVLRKAKSQESFLVYDGQLGWTLGPNRRSENGRWFSSAEGLRSPRAGVAFVDRETSCRIALVGDSYTFDEEVIFEDSWGYQLERLLPRGCQVLNFGVLGYGVDQMYLRYARDVRPWHPDIVVFAPIDFDLLRTMAVYAFLIFPHSEMPWAKPRFDLKDGQLIPLNMPLPSPEVIFSATSIRNLPFITYDWFYFSSEWDRKYWKLFNFSYLFRFIVSWHPVRESRGFQVSDETLKAVNYELLRSFVRLASSERSVPLLVYLPVPTDIFDRDIEGGQVPLGLRMMRETGTETIDLIPCLREVDSGKLFAPNGHYTAQANLSVARCLSKVVINHLPK